MKKILFLSLISMVLVSACEEIAPTITLLPTTRKVVIEEFTGVQCVNCPAGTKKIEDLVGIYGEDLIVVSIHSGQFAIPYKNSHYDFRTPIGDNLNSYLGPPSGYPSAVINRKWFAGQQERVVYLSDWAGFVQKQLQEPPKVRLDVGHSYAPSSRTLTLDIAVYCLENVTETVYLSVLLTENEVKDYQLKPEGWDSTYQHQHILRETLSNNYFGDKLGTNLVAGTNLSKRYVYELPENIAAKKAKVVIMVNLSEGNDLSVLQATEISVEN